MSQANPHVLLGALLEGPADGTDSFPNVRTDNGSQVAVENNAGFSTAMVATYQTTKPSWPECLQGFGFFRKVSLMIQCLLRLPACICGRVHLRCQSLIPTWQLCTFCMSIDHGVNCDITVLCSLTLVSTQYHSLMSVAGPRLLIPLRARRTAAA